MADLTVKVADYFERRKLKWPNFEDAMKFMHTEIGEVYELDLSRTSGWVRNNPNSKPIFDHIRLGEELGDVIMMVIVAGIAEGIDVIDCLEKKMERKLSELGE